MNTNLASSFLRGRYQRNPSLGVTFVFDPSLLDRILIWFPFSQHRPLGTTFKGKYGCVDYWVKAFLDRPSQPTQEIKKNFEVMDLVDVTTPELLVRFLYIYISPGLIVLGLDSSGKPALCPKVGKESFGLGVNLEKDAKS